MPTEQPLLGRQLRRALIAGTLLLAAYCVFVILPDGSGREWIMAGMCASFPFAAWLEASRLRRRGLPEAADAIIAWAFAAVLGFSFLAHYAADLRDEAGEPVNRVRYR